MRILCYTNKLNHGGAERVMSILANNLYSYGHSVILVNDYHYDDEYPINENITHYYIDGYYEEKKSGLLSRTARRIRFLRKICKENNIDILVSFISDANYRAILSTIGTSTKNVISVRNDPYKDYASKFKKMISEFFYGISDGCVFQTDRALHFFSKRIQKHSCIIENPISELFFEIDNSPLKEKKIVSCGRLTKQKRFDVLINAFSIVKKEHPEYILEIYGDGELTCELRNQIQELELEDSVFLMGRSSKIQIDIGNASVFVLSSDFEGMPNALLEALALGIPCVSTDCDGGGPRSIICNGKNGLLVPKDNPQEMAKAILSILNDDALSNILSMNAKMAGLSYSPENIVKKWEAFFQSLI